MDPIALILSALTAGAVAALQETVGTAIKDAYKGLVKLISAKFKTDAKAKAILKNFEEDPETWEKPLAKALKELEAIEDKKILATAQKLLELVQSQDPSSKKYEVRINGEVQGLIQGDHAKATMNFNEAPTKRKKR